MDLIGGGRGPPRQLRFKNFACQNERNWTRRGGRAPGAPPLDPPMILQSKMTKIIPICKTCNPLQASVRKCVYETSCGDGNRKYSSFEESLFL